MGVDRKRLQFGDKFGRLTVIGRTGEKYLNTNAYLYKCLCECGETKLVISYDLKSGNTRSCGCLKREDSSSRMKDLRKKSNDISEDNILREQKKLLNKIKSLSNSNEEFGNDFKKELLRCVQEIENLIK